MPQNSYPILPAANVVDTSTTEPKAFPAMPKKRDQKSILEDEVLNLFERSEVSFAGANSSFVEQRTAMGEALLSLHAIITSEKMSWSAYLGTTFKDISRRTLDACIRLAKAKIAPQYRFLGMVTLNRAISAAEYVNAPSINDWLCGVLGQADQNCAKGLTDAKEKVHKAIGDAKKARKTGTLELSAAPLLAQMLTEIYNDAAPIPPSSNSSADEARDNEPEPEQGAESEDDEDEDEAEEDNEETLDSSEDNSGNQQEPVTAEVLKVFFEYVDGIIELDEQIDLRAVRVDKGHTANIAKAIEILTAIHITN